MSTKRIVLALAILVLAGLACSTTDRFFSKSSPETGIQPEQYYGEEQVVPLEASISAYPNLELFAVLGDSQELGSGMKRVEIWLYGKNASSGWWSYAVEGTLGFSSPTQCAWSIGADMWSGYFGELPLLLTKEGYTYEAVRDYQMYCGPRFTWDIPPGLEFNGLGETYEEVLGWGEVKFDIPSSAIPDTLTLSYEDPGNIFTLSEGYEIQTVSTQVLTGEQLPPWLGPFDKEYDNYVGIYRLGEEVQEAQLAAVTVISEGLRPDGSLLVQLNVRSLDKGYPIELDLGSSASLVFENGYLCCYSTLWKWDTSIGPEQSTMVEVTFENLPRLRTWLLLGLVFKETAGAETEGRTQFVVELP